MSAFVTPLAAMNAAQLRRFGESFTYTPAGGSGVSITGILSCGDQTQEEGAFARVWFLKSALAAEPLPGDVVAVPAGRRIEAGNYRVANPKRRGDDSREVDLVYIRP